ncbi:hypothetical protein ACFZA1_41415 [Streptomyces filipinensis]|uniref:hypothetical protein n=1 Tax=Streptomyces filipinensis TaxID=66887 RepID=UPI0036E43F1C
MTTIRKALVTGRPLPAHQADDAQLTLAQRITALLDSVPAVQWLGELGGDCDDSWWSLTEDPPVTTYRQARLSRLRRSTLDTAVSRAGATYKVVLYASVAAGTDPAPVLDLAEEYARARGWLVVARLADARSAAGPGKREQWRQALKALRGGFAQGVVTVDRSTVSPTDESYEQTLHWLLDHFSFVAHVRPRPAVGICA